MSTLLTFVTTCGIALAYFKFYGIQVLVWFIAFIYLWRKSQFGDISKDVRGIAFVTLALLILDYFR